jgi:hypothetical protein
MKNLPHPEDTIEFEPITPEQLIKLREAEIKDQDGIDPYNSSTRIPRPDFDVWLNRK